MGSSVSNLTVYSKGIPVSAAEIQTLEVLSYDTNFGFLKMESILATFFHEHHQHEAWWYKIKMTLKMASHSTKDAMLASDEAPGQHCASKLLGIMMHELLT